jgi:hypothetical protein
VPAGVYIATNYGAIGDGVADDTAAIQALINTVAATGGGVVFVPAGKYLQSAEITIGASVHLYGVGVATTFLSKTSIAKLIHVDGSGAGIHDLNMAVLGASSVVGIGLHVDGGTHGQCIENISCATITGTAGKFNEVFRFEQSWGGSYRNLSTNGHAVTRACFVVGANYNANEASGWYTSNLGVVYNFLSESGAGHGNNFSMITCQGGKYGIKIRGGNQWAFSGLYFENAVIPLSLGAGGATGTTTATTVNGSPNITVASATGIAYGQLVSGASIPADTTVFGIAGTTITLSNPCTADGSGVSATFTSSPAITGMSFASPDLGGAYATHPQYAYRTAALEALNCFGITFDAPNFSGGLFGSSNWSLTTITAPAGSGAEVAIRIKPDGTIADAVVLQSGSGYTSGITIVPNTAVGSGAVLVGTIADIPSLGILKGLASVAVSGAGSSFFCPPLPLAVLYDTCGRVDIRSPYINDGRGTNSAMWPWIARTGTASSGSAVSVTNDAVRASGAMGDLRKADAFDYKHVLRYDHSDGTSLARIVPMNRWIG